MHFIFLSLFLMDFFMTCFSFPQCCHLFYYSDFGFTCGLSLCQFDEKLVRNSCLSCISKASPDIQNNSNISAHTLRISKPQQLCQDLNSLESGQVILSWSWLEKENAPFLFVIEARNDSSRNREWNIVGLTNKTSVTITHLDVPFQHQFQVRPVISFNLSLFPVASNWIKLRDSNSSLSAPTNITLTTFHLKNGTLEGIIKFIASKESSCSYKLIWKLTNSVSYFKEQTVALLENNSNWLSATLTGLLFDKNYTVVITPLAANIPRKVVSAVAWFMTPTCFNMTKANFSVCAPGPPLNVSVHWNDKDVTIKWIPPRYTSSNNSVLGYNVSVLSEGVVFISLFVDRDDLKASFTHLNFSTNYVFSVRAISDGGTGKSGIAEISVKELKAFDSAPLPYHYMVPFMLILLAIIFVVLTKVHQDTFTNKGYPSGVADVADHLRPFLISPDKIHLREVLGKGAFGIVHRGIYTRSKSKEEVAVKVFPSETYSRHQLLHEVEMLRIAGRHDRIVGLHGISLDVDKMYLILEYCPLGDLLSYLVKLKPQVLRLKRLVKEKDYNMNEKDRDHGKRLCSYIYQVAQGMEYLASLRLVHRDLAARNVLMLSEKRVKIADFGLSRDVYETQVYSGCEQKKLPLKWMAPESIEKQKFSTYTDVWSFGVLMWEIFKLGKEPYPGLTNSRLLEYLKLGYRLEKPHCNQEWYNLMHKCWRQNPIERPHFKQLVKQIGVIIDKMWIYVSVV